MRLYKRPNSPYWWMEFTVSGRTVRKSTKRPLSDEKGAKRVLAEEYRRHHDHVQLGDKKEITLAEAFDLTLGEVKGQTQRLYRTVKGHACDHFRGTTRLSAITQGDVDAYVSKRQALGMKPNTIRAEVKCIRRVINRVAKTYRINPDLDWPKIKPFVKTRYLSDPEETLVLTDLAGQATITAEKAHDLCIFLVDTGMRLMEGVNVQWADIDLTNKRIELFRSKTGTTTVLPMSLRVEQMLRRKLNQPQPFEEMEWAIRLLRKTIHKHCNRNARIVEQKGAATVHSLRDTFATRMLKQGMTIHRLAYLMGHTTTVMTEKYGHLERIDVTEEARSLLNSRAHAA
ncbi:tyrosine-type recombinase/integrase [Rhodosalinus sp.]|uniref:tyrosine-type recombinase/integrase n=1 Tax=Rhodosalinus sp. TaxID=2047741 RepID=UPI00397C0690